MKDFVSIIIPVFNEEKYIRKCIESLLKMEYDVQFMEVIFVDGNSTDKTNEIINKYIQEYEFIKMIKNDKRIVPVSMNLGIKEARGNLIMRMDAHSHYPVNYIKELIGWKRKLGADNVGAICETTIVNNNKKSIAIKNVLANKFGVGNGEFRIGIAENKEVDTVPFGLYDKEMLIKLGGYNEKLVRNQDIELNGRLKANGGKIYLIKDIKFRYYARETYREIIKNNYENGMWNILTIKYTKKIKTFSIRHFVPMIFVMSLVLPLVGSFVNYRCVYISLIVLLAYIMLIGKVSIDLGRNEKNYIQTFIAFISIHCSYGMGSIMGIIASLYK